MRFKSLSAVWTSKIVTVLLKLMGRRATSLPGLIAFQMSDLLLHELLRQVKLCVLVTGTNGKTTTTELLHAILASDEEPWLVNRGGANLLQGLLATLLHSTNWRGRLKHSRAVLEVDEATMPLITMSVRPRMIVVTNVLRDQLDRYGEIDHTMSLLSGCLMNPAITLVTNADDPLCAALAGKRTNHVFFGCVAKGQQDSVVDSPTGAGDVVRDGAFCMNCGHELHYEQFFYGQMGIYACPNCGFARPQLRFGGEFLSDEGGANALRVIEYKAPEEWKSGDEQDFTLDSPLSGLYNAYNLLAAVTAARTLGVSPLRIREGTRRFKAPLGRMQVFPGHPERILALIKNPTGANSVLEAIREDPRGKCVCFVINDHDADGRDVSWLWDIAIESFLPAARCARFVCAGTRASDMALRLAYAGVDRAAIKSLDALDEVLSVGTDDTLPVYVLSTYTALYPLARLIERATGNQSQLPEVTAS